jgi:hypothetical protein
LDEEAFKAGISCQQSDIELPLKDITFTLDMTDWGEPWSGVGPWPFQEPATDRFRTVMELFHRLNGVQCEVWYYVDGRDCLKKMVAPGYVATTIQYGSVEELDDDDHQEERLRGDVDGGEVIETQVDEVQEMGDEGSE